MGSELSVRTGPKRRALPGGQQLTSTLLSHCRTSRKDCLAVRSYMTTTPSAFRKNCWVMQRYLREAPGQVCGLLATRPRPRGARAGGVTPGAGRGVLLTSPAPPCPTAAQPPASRPRTPSSRGNRCLWVEPSITPHPEATPHLAAPGTALPSAAPDPPVMWAWTEPWTASPGTWALDLCQPLTSYGTSIQPLNLSEPQPPHCSVSL